MIRALLGKLGAGKSRILAGELIKELSESNRVIVGNFPVELMPWVMGLAVHSWVGCLSTLAYEKAAISS